MNKIEARHYQDVRLDQQIEIFPDLNSLINIPDQALDLKISDFLR
jgi:hypothetical protein